VTLEKSVVVDCPVDPLRAELEVPVEAYFPVEAVNACFAAEATNGLAP
jgi:hypothetical protein